mmetsp:Transcript_59595/g.122169  ORF Transcript_59595/g.122169 Transcript_59595/m.122169 type:complete len:112 (-) Transcript_59595:68-403(-)
MRVVTTRTTMTRTMMKMMMKMTRISEGCCLFPAFDRVGLRCYIENFWRLPRMTHFFCAFRQRGGSEVMRVAGGSGANRFGCEESFVLSDHEEARLFRYHGLRNSNSTFLPH